MNILTFVGRLGRDAELRDANGTAVCNMAIAYNYGRKDNDGKRPSQWVDAALWGNRAEALVQYLAKGQQVAVSLRDVHVHTFDKSDGSVGTSLRGDVLEISLVGNAPQQQDAGNQQRGQQAPARGPAPRTAAPAARQQPQRQAPARTGGNSGFDDMDSDIPFSDPLKRRGYHLAV